MTKQVGGGVTPRFRHLQLRKRHEKSPDSPGAVAWKITGVYLVSGGLWILLSGRILRVLVNDVATFERISLVKGWLYVLVTAFIIYELVFSSLSRAKQTEDQFRHWTLHDHITRLPNRRALYEDLHCTLANQDAHGALFFIDLDNFKHINDYMGHGVGDELLGNVGQRLSIVDSGAKVYRFAGDEYVLHMPNARYEDSVKVATRLYEDFAHPFELKNANTVYLAISTGVVLYPDHGTIAEDLLKKADIAMRYAEEVRNSYRFFDDSMERDVSESIILEQGLRSALLRNELSVNYQPQYDVKTDRVCGFEALLRWNSPSLGQIPPSQFIPLAERSGLIVPMGQMVLERACRFIQRIHNLGYPDLTVSVNVSMQQLLRSDYVDSVVLLLNQVGLEPKYLELEITESLLMQSYELIRDKLFVLRRYGIRIALDDFGTGYSSLRHLRELPISTLKIDRVFVDELHVPGNRLLMGEIITIGKGIGMTIIAEGIEEPEQLAFLKAHGCDKFQGYLYSRAISDEEIFAKCSKHKELHK